MIFYKNFHRKFQNKQEEIEAIKQLNGMDMADKSQFELITLILKKALPHPEKKHGFQDTDITHREDGSVLISNREPGMGTLKFEPNNYGNPVGFLAKTEHNLKMLVHCYAQKEWTFQDRNLEQEVKGKFDLFWEGLSDTDKRSYRKQDELRKMDRFDAPSLIPQEKGEVKTDNSLDKLMDRISKLENENARLKAEIKDPPNAIIKEELPPEAVPEPIVIEVTKVINKDGKVYDFQTMMLFEVRQIAKEYGVNYNNQMKKAELVPLLIDAIEKQKLEVPVG